MTTGRINQVATSRIGSPIAPQGATGKTDRTRCPHRARPAAPTVPADGQSVCQVKRPDHCDQWYTSKNPGLRPRALSSPPPRPKGPSCCLLASFLGTSYRGAAAGGRLQAWARDQASASRGPSGRCAIVDLRCAVRAASLPRVPKHTGLSPPLSHAIGSVLMLGIAYERDASVRRPAARERVRGRASDGRRVAGPPQRTAAGPGDPEGIVGIGWSAYLALTRERRSAAGSARVDDSALLTVARMHASRVRRIDAYGSHASSYRQRL